MSRYNSHQRRQEKEVLPIHNFASLPFAFKAFDYREDFYSNSTSKRAFGLALPFSQNWDRAKHRILLVVQTVSNFDLRSGTLLTPGSTAQKTVSNLFAEAFATAVRYDPTINPKEYALGVVNWNAFKVFDLPMNEERRSYPTFTQRVEKWIEKMNPTQLIISGDQAAASLLPHVENLEHKRGWIHKKGKLPCVTTLDLDALISAANRKDNNEAESGGRDEKGKEADLLFYMSRNIVHALLKKHPHSIRHVVPNPVYVGTIDRFTMLMSKLESEGSPLVAFDIETRNLESYNNDIYMVQFAFNEKRGYVLPIDHPKTPFNDEEVAYIKKRLRRFFSRSTPATRKRLIGQNLAFDLRVIRAQLDIDIIQHDVHDLTAGENLLDENLGIFAKIITRYGKLESRENLRAIVTSYDNDWYFTAAFSKEERMTIGLFEPDDPNVLAYGAADVQFPFAVAAEQLKAANYQSVYDWRQKKYVNYGPWYQRHLYEQMSAAVHAISTMMQHGSAVDTDYMRSLLKKDSILKNALAEELGKLRRSKAAQRVNKALLKVAGVATGGLFGKKSDPWVLSLTRPAHKQALYIQELGIEPLALTKSGAPQLNKKFNEAYKDEYPEVAILSEFQELSKLLGTYVSGWLDKIRLSPDSVSDARFRTVFQFFRIVTGRLGSEKPNHQNIPSRGKRAKIIKRMFRAAAGYLQIRADYSAHEVKMWALSAEDEALIKSFAEGLALRQSLIVAETSERPAIFEALKKRGDVHIQNVFRIFKQWVDKSHVLRDTVKGMIFGAIYGLGLLSMAASLRLNKIRAAEQDKQRVEEKLEASGLSGTDKRACQAAIAEYEKQIEELRVQEPLEFKDEADEILKKMWTSFKSGKEYLDKVALQVQKRGFVNAWTGRKRNMYRVLTGNRGYLSSAERSAKNAPIQGIASELGLKAAYLVLMEFDKTRRERKLNPKFPLYTRMVHDANYFEVPYENVIPFLWVYQYVSTFGIAKDYESTYGLKFPVPPEIEVEMSASEDAAHKWDWTLIGLRKSIEGALDDQIKLGVLAKEERQSVLDLILEPAKDKKLMAYLQENYPLLGVKKLPQHAYDDLLAESAVEST